MQSQSGPMVGPMGFPIGFQMGGQMGGAISAPMGDQMGVSCSQMPPGANYSYAVVAMEPEEMKAPPAASDNTWLGCLCGYCVGCMAARVCLCCTPYVICCTGVGALIIYCKCC